MTTIFAGEKSADGKRGKKTETKLVDSGAGFFIEEGDGSEVTAGADPERLSSLPAPILISDQPHCDECGQLLADSFMFRSVK